MCSVCSLSTCYRSKNLRERERRADNGPSDVWQTNDAPRRPQPLSHSKAAAPAPPRAKAGDEKAGRTNDGRAPDHSGDAAVRKRATTCVCIGRAGPLPKTARLAGRGRRQEQRERQEDGGEEREAGGQQHFARARGMCRGVKERGPRIGSGGPGEGREEGRELRVEEEDEGTCWSMFSHATWQLHARALARVVSMRQRYFVRRASRLGCEQRELLGRQSRLARWLKWSTVRAGSATLLAPTSKRQGGKARSKIDLFTILPPPQRRAPAQKERGPTTPRSRGGLAGSEQGNQHVRAGAAPARRSKGRKFRQRGGACATACAPASSPLTCGRSSPTRTRSRHRPNC